MWKLKLASSCESLTKNGLEALQNCDKDIYPNIHFLFKILVTLPVSTATPERSFSTLKRLKSYCRNSMNEVFQFFLYYFLILLYNIIIYNVLLLSNILLIIFIFIVLGTS
jgi:hypothetical protein